MKVKIAMFKMKIKELSKVVTVDDLHIWEDYPGDQSFSLPADVKKPATEDTIYGLDYNGKKMIYLSAN